MKIDYSERKRFQSMYSTQKYVQTKSLLDIPKSVLKNVKLISLPLGKSGDVFGSYANRMADYYGDIDVIQLISDFKDIKEIGPKTAKAIQEVVQKIKEERTHWYSEVKAGLDHAYVFWYGDLENGVFTPSDDLIPKSVELNELGLLSDDELKVIKELGSKKGDGDDYDVVYNIFRSHFILRWTEKEILQGWKETSVGKYSLSDAVVDKTVVKIDMIIKSKTGKYLEVTNFIGLGIEENGFIKSINLEKHQLTPEMLPFEIEKLYYSNFYYSPFKMVKRAFAYLKWVRKNLPSEKWLDKRIDPYIKLLKTSIGILYSVKSELEAMCLILNKASSLTGINNRLDQLKEPISNVLEIESDQLKDIMLLVDEIIAVPIKEKGIKFDMMKQLIDIFKQIINFWTIAYSDQLGVNPPKEVVLPIKRSYNPNIIREPWSNPVNPFKILKGGCSDCGGICGGSWLGNIASSIFQKAANAYRRNFCDGKARQLEKGEYHYGCHNFTGPGTRVDLKKVRDYPPYNNIDKCSRQHDMDYVKAIELPDKERIAAINKADKDVINCYDKYPNENGYRVSKMGINSKMSLAKVLPMVSKSVFGKISASGKVVVDSEGKRELILP